MSAYVSRRCQKHGEWDDDVDCPSECPECLRAGITCEQIQAKEIARLQEMLREQVAGRIAESDENARLRADLASARKALLMAWSDYPLLSSEELAFVESELKKAEPDAHQ